MAIQKLSVFFRQRLNNKISFSVLVVALIITSAFILINSKQVPESSPVQIEGPRAESTGSQPETSQSFLATGVQSYRIMQGEDKSPQIERVTFDPVDVESGEEQGIKVEAKYLDTHEIGPDTEVQANVKTDSKTFTVPLELKHATSDQEDLSTEWKGTWQFDDSYDKQYLVKIIAQTETNSSSATITLR